MAGSAALLAFAGQALAQVKDYRDIKTPPLRQFTMPQPKRVALPNGMVIFLQEDHELPLIRGTVNVRGGARDIPANKAGLAAIYGSAWRTGGTESRDGDKLDEILESRAARLETVADDDSSAITVNVLKQDFDFVFPILVELLQKPAFRQEKIDLAKTQVNTGISRRNDDASDIAAREAARLGYGTDSPYTREPEYETVASITRQDLIDFHKRSVHPNNIIMGFVGDFDSAAMEKKLRAAFGSWPKGPAAPKPDQTINPAKPGVYLVSKPDVNQSNIYLVHGGAMRNTPDYYPMLVMNEILSGGFSGRLMNDLRTARGLAYGVSGGIGTEWDHPGLFRVWIGTKSGTTLEAITALRGHIDALINKPYANEELEFAKDSILNAFVFTRDTRSDVLGQAMTLEFYGYPANWYDQYVGGVQKVTNDDLVRVARKYVTPDKLSVLVVGNEKEFEKPLTTLGLGDPRPIDITIPEPGAKPAASSSAAPGAAAPAAATVSSADGIALARKVVDFTGGKAKIDAVQSLRTTASLAAKTPQGEMQIEIDAVVKYPDTQRNVMKTAMGEMTRVLTPTSGFMLTPGGAQDMPTSQRDAMASEMKTETLNVLKNVDNPKYVFTAGGSEKIGDVDARALLIAADGASATWWIDPATGRLLRKVAKAPGPMPGENVIDYADWKPFGGVLFPTSIVVTRGGEKAAEQKVLSIEVNPTLDAKLFEKPAAP
jgi:zinc protease